MDLEKPVNGILIYLLPEDCVLDVLVKYDKLYFHYEHNVTGLKIYFKHYESTKKNILLKFIIVKETNYYIYPVVTNLTIHGIRTYAEKSEIVDLVKERYCSVRVIDCYGTKYKYNYVLKRTEDYRVILDIPENIAFSELDVNSVTIPEVGEEFFVTYFCRLCRQNDHMQYQCQNKALSDVPNSPECMESYIYDSNALRTPERPSSKIVQHHASEDSVGNKKKLKKIVYDTSMQKHKEASKHKTPELTINENIQNQSVISNLTRDIPADITPQTFSMQQIVQISKTIDNNLISKCKRALNFINFKSPDLMPKPVVRLNQQQVLQLPSSMQVGHIEINNSPDFINSETDNLSMKPVTVPLTKQVLQLPSGMNMSVNGIPSFKISSNSSEKQKEIRNNSAKQKEKYNGVKQKEKNNSVKQKEKNEKQKEKNEKQKENSNNNEKQKEKNNSEKQKENSNSSEKHIVIDQQKQAKKRTLARSQLLNTGKSMGQYDFGEGTSRKRIYRPEKNWLSQEFGTANASIYNNIDMELDNPKKKRMKFDCSRIIPNSCDMNSEKLLQLLKSDNIKAISSDDEIKLVQILNWNAGNGLIHDQHEQEILHAICHLLNKLNRIENSDQYEAGNTRKKLPINDKKRSETEQPHRTDNNPPRLGIDKAVDFLLEALNNRDVSM